MDVLERVLDQRPRWWRIREVEKVNESGLTRNPSAIHRLMIVYIRHTAMHINIQYIFLCLRGLIIER